VKELVKAIEDDDAGVGPCWENSLESALL